MQTRLIIVFGFFKTAKKIKISYAYSTSQSLPLRRFKLQMQQIKSKMQKIFLTASENSIFLLAFCLSCSVQAL